MLETEFKDLCKRLNGVILSDNNPYLDLVQAQILEYFDGKRKNFDIDLHTVGTTFQQQVWQMLLKIPYGKTWSYKYQVEILGKPAAARAVANANGVIKLPSLCLVIESLQVMAHSVVMEAG